MRKPTADRSGVHVWLVLMKAHRSMVRHAARSIIALEMGISDFAVLELLLHKGPQAVGEIGRRVELTSGSITTAIDRLERRGLVARTAHASDRRTRVVHLTREGRTRIRHVFATIAARHAEVIDFFTPADDSGSMNDAASPTSSAPGSAARGA